MNGPSLEAQHAALVYFSLEVARPFVHWAGLVGTGRILVNSEFVDKEHRPGSSFAELIQLIWEVGIKTI